MYTKLNGQIAAGTTAMIETEDHGGPAAKLGGYHASNLDNVGEEVGNEDQRR